METPRNGRLAYVDAARGVAIMAVVLYHAQPPVAVRPILLSYGLTLFLFISGFLIKSSHFDHPVRYILRRVRRLWVPFVCWGLFYLLLHNFLLDIGVYSTVVRFHAEPTVYLGLDEMVRAGERVVAFRGVEHLGGGLWFLPLLFFAEMILVLLGWVSHRFGTGRGLVLAVGVLGVSAAGLANQNFVDERLFYSNAALTAVLVLFVGFLFRRAEPILRWSAVGAVVSALIVVLLGGVADYGGNSYAGPLQLVVASLAGGYATFFATRGLSPNRALEYVGKNTIFILATHFAAFKLVSLLLIWLGVASEAQLARSAIDAGGLWWALYFAVGILVPVGLKIVVDAAARRLGYLRYHRTRPEPVELANEDNTSASQEQRRPHDSP